MDRTRAVRLQESNEISIAAGPRRRKVRPHRVHVAWECHRNRGITRCERKDRSAGQRIGRANSKSTPAPRLAR